MKTRVFILLAMCLLLANACSSGANGVPGKGGSPAAGVTKDPMEVEIPKKKKREANGDSQFSSSVSVGGTFPPPIGIEDPRAFRKEEGFN